MKILNSKLHGYLDFVVVLAFALAPTLLGFTNQIAMLCYALAGVHLALTLFTNFPFGFASKIIPMKIHGWVELAVAPTLVAIPRVLGFFGGEATASAFFTIAGVVVFGVWLCTDYKNARKSSSSTIRRAA